MGFNSLVSSQPQYNSMRSVTDGERIGVDGGVPSSFPVASVRGSATTLDVESLASLSEAFAGVPNDLSPSSVAGFRVVVHGRERELRAGLRDEVYRICREAIVNACRHSRARDIETEVEYRPNELRIAVRDNGCGIDPQKLLWGRNGHWGLQGMRERAERIGARLKLRSRPAAGTEVELSIPSQIAFQH